jgi:hypothetical protein
MPVASTSYPLISVGSVHWNASRRCSVVKRSNRLTTSIIVGALKDSRQAAQLPRCRRGSWTRYGQWLRRPVGLIHWAGTETADEWTGFLDGAVRSGQRAAAEVAARL